MGMPGKIRESTGRLFRQSREEKLYSEQYLYRKDAMAQRKI
jgi:hypothetical protein